MRIAKIAGPRTALIGMAITIAVAVTGLVVRYVQADDPTCYSYLQTDGGWVTGNSAQAAMDTLVERLQATAGGWQIAGHQKEATRFSSVVAAARASTLRQLSMPGGVQMVAENDKGQLLGSFDLVSDGTRWTLVRLVAAVPVSYCS